MAPISSRQYSLDNTPSHDTQKHRTESRGYLADDLAKGPLAAAGIDLKDSVDTSLHTKYAPAVTHETVQPVMREVREEHITREIHDHDVIHRILPVKEIEVLPTRHYIPSSNGELNEVSAASIPGVTGSNQNWQVVEMLSKGAEAPLAPRAFTARSFEGSEGDYEENVEKDGIHRSKTTWVHPPTLQTGGMETGQTEPLHLGQRTFEGCGSSSVRRKPVPVGQEISDAGASQQFHQEALHLGRRTPGPFEMPGGWYE